MTWCELFFHIKVNILKSLFHFVVAKVKPAMSLRWGDLTSPAHFWKTATKSTAIEYYFTAVMSHMSEIIGEP